jgi:hypothetical protein
MNSHRRSVFQNVLAKVSDVVECPRIELNGVWIGIERYLDHKRFQLPIRLKFPLEPRSRDEWQFFQNLAN